MLLLFLAVFGIYFSQVIKMPPPKITDLSSLEQKRTEISPGFYALGNNRLRKSDTGLWEMYIEGEPFSRGVSSGRLSSELITLQEDAFIAEIKRIVPSDNYLKFLKYFVAWFNRRMEKYIPEEYMQEAYGVSFSVTEKYNVIGSAFERILNYHGAHDTGHMLQDLALVGCTAFSCRNGKTPDGKLIVGRNFDFYAGDAFAENKIVTFYNPRRGYKLVTITWGGFIGAVSGLNDQGLALVINAGKSELPGASAVPVSLIAREILQYAATIDEAFRIAESRKSFVAEAFFVASARENRSVIIEKTPHEIGIFDPGSDTVIVPNHYQSGRFLSNKLNLQNIKESSSLYRLRRMEELTGRFPKIDYREAAVILRDQKGMGGSNIGMGNEKAMNQLISHHSVIIKPSELKIWISTAPWQLGRYVCYDLDRVFKIFPGLAENRELYEENFTIPEDEFLFSKSYIDFTNYRVLYKKAEAEITNRTITNVNFALLDELTRSNPEFFAGHELAGNYCLAKKNYPAAQKYYLTALQKEITTVPEKKRIEKNLELCRQDKPSRRKHARK